VCDESRSGFASRRARGVIHDPGVRVRTRPSFSLALRLAPRLMRAMAMFMLPTFDADLLSAVPLTLTRLMLLASVDTCHSAFFDQVLAGPRGPPADHPHRLPDLRRRAARRK